MKAWGKQFKTIQGEVAQRCCDSIIPSKGDTDIHISGNGEIIEFHILTDAELKEEINKHIQTIARCGKAGVIEAYLAGQLEEYIKEERRKAEREGLYNLLKHMKEQAYEKRRRIEDYAFTMFELQQYIEAYEKSLEGDT